MANSDVPARLGLKAMALAWLLTALAWLGLSWGLGAKITIKSVLTVDHVCSSITQNTLATRQG